MRKKKELILISLISVFTGLNSISSIAAQHQMPYEVEKSSDDSTLFVSRSKHYYQENVKTISSKYGNASVEYKFSGNYTYDVNSGAITKSYGEQLDEFYFTPPLPSDLTPEPENWRYDIINISLKPRISGDTVELTIKFTLRARYFVGGLYTKQEILIPVTDVAIYSSGN